MKIGIIQGRLSPPIEGFQETPANWRNEFKLLDDMNLNHIEWVITSSSFSYNPFFVSDMGAYQHKINMVSADNIVHKEFYCKDFLRHNLEPICKAAVKNQIQCVAIPILEESSPLDEEKRKIFSQNILDISKDFPELDFYFESDLDPNILLEILDLSDRFFVTYDTGNITSCGLDHEEYIIKLLDRIKNVHLKDRTIDAKTVPPTTGDTNFNLIFGKLKELGYNKTYTIQTAREQSGCEQKTIARHKKLFQEIYNECA